MATKKPKAEPKIEYRHYLHCMAGQLAQMAQAENLPVVANLFKMAEQAAAEDADAEALQALREKHGLGRG